MPYINTTTTKKITDEQMDSLVREFGKAIEIIPGKTEKWLMLNFNDSSRMFFRGTDEGGAAMLEVEFLGAADSSVLEKLTAKLCKILTDILGISGDRIYVKYREVDCWGYDGSNF